ncbi:MAG: biopolymer transporter ExbD [Phycisphaerae bacterium]|nr:biopolymer transporter ExbD [Phycisphaerae bacterium]
MASESTQRGRADQTDLSSVEGTDTVHHPSSARKREPERGVRQLNLTSMLDVTFQLLIFFVLTASFAMNEGILAADLPQGVPPEPTEPQPPPDEPLIIVLRPVGTDDVSLWIERGESIPDGDFDRLYEILNGWRYDPEQNPNGMYESDNPIIIKPATEVRWAHVVSAFNAVIRANYTNVSFAQSG